MSNVHNRIQQLIVQAGPIIREELVHVGAAEIEGKPNPDYRELGKFPFKRLSFYELDSLRLHSVNSKGVFDPALHAGNNARFVAATLMDEEGNPAETEQSVNMWPAWMVEAFHDAAQRVNSTASGSKELIEKNSDSTPSEEHS